MAGTIMGVGVLGPSGGTASSAAALPPGGRVRVVTALLGLVAGISDAVGFLVMFGVFTAHMTGNTTHLGVSLADEQWTDAVVRAFPIPMFVVAIAIGTAVVETLRRRRDERPHMAPLLVVEALLLLGFMAVAAWAIETDRLRPASFLFFVLATLMTLAMGLQTAVLRHVGGLTVHTTYISGMLTQAAVGMVTWIFDRRDGHDRRGDPDRPAVHTWLALGVWGCFAIGALLGALAHRVVHEWTMLAPALILVALALYAHGSRRLTAHQL